MDKIDLTKPQLIEGDVKIRVWNNGGEKEERYLALISPGGVFWCWFNGYTGGYYKYKYGGDNLCFWDNAELIEKPPKPKTRLMTRREIMAKVCTMDKEYPFLVGLFPSFEKMHNEDFSDWEAPQWWTYEGELESFYYRHIHPITGEWTSEPSQFLIEVKEGEE